MLPVVALIGRPNVGKSTLFNVLTRTRDALVHDMPGVTRDRHYGVCRLGERPFVLVDTGGLSGEDAGMDALTARQVHLAVAEAHVVVLVTDGRAGLTALDRDILADVRKRGKALLVAVNKTDGIDAEAALTDFTALGVGTLLPLAAAHSRGLDRLVATILPLLPAADDTLDTAADGGIRVAIVGRPNVGKSTLVNRLLGEERVVVSDVAGTTRDAIRVPLERDGKRYTLIDTAGVRRRGKVTDVIEKFSVVKTLQAIEDCNVSVLMIDATEGVADQDANIAGYILEAGRAVVVAVNKWDAIDLEARERLKAELERKLQFLGFARTHFISARKGTGVASLMRSVDDAFMAAMKKLPTPKLTRALIEAVERQQPPRRGPIRPKMRYAHQGGQNPPIIVIHGTSLDAISETYRRYLEGWFRKEFALEGTPLRIEFRVGANPYAQ